MIPRNRLRNVLDTDINAAINYQSRGSGMEDTRPVINNNTYKPDLPDHIYLQGTLFNNSFADINSIQQYIPATIAQTRDSPFVIDPSQYNLTITRFSISSEAIARAYQSILSNSSPTGTRFFVGLSYNGQYYNEAIVIPTITDGYLQQVKAEYSIYGFLDLINAGYLAAQNAMILGGGPTGPTGQQVLMTYNPVSQLYDMNIPAHYGTGTVGNTGQGVGVGMSYFLYQKFQSFDVFQAAPLTYNGARDITFNRVWRADNLVNNIYTNIGTGGTGNTGPYMQLRQEVAWPSAIMDVSRLVLTSSSLPIVSEFKAVTNYLDPNASGNKTQGIVTDFLIGRDSELQSLGESLRYLPPFYRLTSLKGNSPIQQWDISVGLEANSGEFFPLYIGPGQSLDIKLLFIKRGLSN